MKETLRIRQGTKRGWIECPVGGCFDWSYPRSAQRRGRVQEGGNVSPALTAGAPKIYYFEKVEEE